LKLKSFKSFNLAAAWVLALGSVTAAVSTIAIPNIELGGGINSRPACLSTAIVDFGTTVNGELSSVSVSNVGADCTGQWVRLSLFSSSDGSGTPIEQIVWQLPQPSSPPVTTFTLSANGSTTVSSSSNIWPVSESGSAGLSLTPIDSSAVNSFLLETSDTLLIDGP
jgi:hypothetical protein